MIRSIPCWRRKWQPTQDSFLFFSSFPFIFISWRLITLPPTQDSCLENSTHREAWRATVHGVTKSRTQLGDSKQHLLLLWKHLWFVMLYVLAHTNYASRSWRELNLTEGSDKAVLGAKESSNSLSLFQYDCSTKQEQLQEFQHLGRTVLNTSVSLFKASKARLSVTYILEKIKHTFSLMVETLNNLSAYIKEKHGILSGGCERNVEDWEGLFDSEVEEIHFFNSFPSIQRQLSIPQLRGHWEGNPGEPSRQAKQRWGLP